VRVVNEVWSVDPRTGQRRRLVAHSTSAQAVEIAVEAATLAGKALVGMGRAARATLLRGVADALHEREEKLIEVADRETGLGLARLGTEFRRTTAQLRLFADVVEDGGYQELIVTRARPELAPPVPELRRMLVPVGPVAIFGASNFPFAFSVLGGDTAAALAAGCPVLFKCHSGHPETSVMTLEAWHQACIELGAPEDALRLVFGRVAGQQLVVHPEVKAASFTGSVDVGRYLHDLAASRPDPIPFYAELAGVNPLVVTEGAAAGRAEEIGRGAAASFTQNGGQFCTKPGLLFVPVGPDGDRVVAAAADFVRGLDPVVLLTAGTRDSYTEGLDALSRHRSVRTLVRVAPSEVASEGEAEGFVGSPALLQVTIDELDRSAIRECFGPVALVVRYAFTDDVVRTLGGLDGALAAAVHSTDDEGELTAELTRAVLPKVGRVVYNGYPTGVAVTAAMTHGGPWPATTNALHSSVGPTATRRFLRPVTYQDAPLDVLPDDLRAALPTG
jgi:NADP-dependent aldehyde dehydrogenase